MEDTEARHRFEELYAGAYRKVLAYSIQRTPSREDADEVVAETFLVAWRRLEDVLAADNSLAWLFGVAYRVLANQRRQQERRERLELRLGAGVEQSFPDTAHRRVESRDLLVEVTELLNELPPRYQEVLRLTAYQGCSPVEIASILQIPPSLARTLLYRARRRLRRILDERHPGWGLVLEEPE